MLYTSGTPQAALYDENNYEQKKRSAYISLFNIYSSLLFCSSPFTLHSYFALRSCLNALFFILPNRGLLLLETDTEANAADAVAGAAVATVGRTQGRTAKVPRAAPKDTAGARCAGIERIGLGTR